MKIEASNGLGGKKYRLQPDPVTSKVVQDIFAKRILGYGYRHIAYNLNEKDIFTARGGTWTGSAIYSLLRNNQEAYLGTLVFNKWDHKTVGQKYKDEKEWVRVENAWEPIVTKEEVNIINSSFEKKVKSIRTPRINEYALTGYLTCGVCGSAVSGTTSGRKGGYHYYRCNKSRDSGSSACNLRMMPQKQIENLVLSDFKRHFLNDNNLRDLIKISIEKAELKLSDSMEILTKLEISKQEAEKRKKNLLDAIESGVISMPDVSGRIKKLNMEIASIGRELEKARLEAVPPVPMERWDLDSLRSQLMELFKGDYPSPLTLVAKSFIEDIGVFGDHLEIQYRWSPGKNKIGFLRLAAEESDLQNFNDSSILDPHDDVPENPAIPNIHGAEDWASPLRTSARVQVPALHFPDIMTSSVVCF
jgi:hypothetical protein